MITVRLNVADADELALAARAARAGLERSDLPVGDFIVMEYGGKWRFAVKRNAKSISVWSQQEAGK